MSAISVGEIQLARGQNIPYSWFCFSFRLLYIIEYIIEQCYIVLYLVWVKLKGFVNQEGTAVERVS